MKKSEVASRPTISVARHETFHLRDGWLAKGLTAIEGDPLALSKPGAHHDLGVGKNMLASLRYWVQAAGLSRVEGKRMKGGLPLVWSDFGHAVARMDPFIEDPVTLWLIQVQLCSNRELASLWYWAFNEFDDFEFADDDLVEGFSDWAAASGHDDVNERSVRKDVHVFLRTYRGSDGRTQLAEETLDCPLTALGLIEDGTSRRRHRFSVGKKKALSASVVAYATSKYLMEATPARDVASIDELRWAPRSPGRLLLLDTRALTEALELVEEEFQGTWLRVSQTAGLRNVHLKDDDLGRALERSYGVAK